MWIVSEATTAVREGVMKDTAEVVMGSTGDDEGT
jgi:hypothetical protein